MKYRLVTLAVTILAMALLAAGCGGSSQKAPSASPAPKATDGGTVKVGVLLPITGKVSAWGASAKLAVQMAVDEYNSGKSPNDPSVELIIEDDGGDRNQAVALTRKLVTQDEVAAIVGPFLSDQTQVTVPLAKQLTVPIIIPASTIPGIIEPQRPWAIRSTVPGDIQNIGGMKQWLQKTGIKKAVVAYNVENAATKSAGAEQYPKGAQEAGIEILNLNDPITWDYSTTDFSTQVTKLKQYVQKGAQGLLFNDVSGTGAKFALEMKRQGVKLPAYSGASAFPQVPEFIQLAGDAGEDWAGISTWWPDPNQPKIKKFFDDFKARIKQSTGKEQDPSSYDASWYSTMLITTEIIKNQKVNNTTSLDQARAAIRDGWNAIKDYDDGLDGKVTILPNGEAQKTLYLSVLKNGQGQLMQ